MAMVGERIRAIRKARGITLERLALAVDSDTGNLSRLERGKQGYSEELVRKIAKVLGVSVTDFFIEESNVEPATIGTRRVPIIDYVQAGLWTGVVERKSESDIFEYLLTDLDLSPDAFAMRIRGDSMEPEFHEGDMIIVDPALAPQPGDFVVAANGGGEATFKQYRERGINERGNEVFELVPLNSLYGAVRSDIKPIKIVGVMVEHRRYRRRDHVSGTARLQ